jgi:Ca2+-binding RTX toxin-like protein
MTLLVLVVPGAAFGDATVTSDGTTATVTGTDAGEGVDVQVYDGKLLFRGAVVEGAGCQKQEWGGDIECPLGTGGADVNLGGGDDRVSSYLEEAPAPRYVRYDLGAGDDRFEGQGSEVVHGGPGNDDINGWTGDDEVDGGDGNDKVDGGQGADVVRGGAGDDQLKSDPMESHKPDVVDGGPGRDSITDWMSTEDPATAPAVTVTLDGKADDGFPGEGDNVTGMEIVESYGGLRYVGTDGADIARAAEVGSRSELSGLGGDDVLKGGDDDDRIDGGAGADDLQGGYGNDTIVGGPGQDKIVADRDGRCNEMHCDLGPGSASDTIDARDGEVDNISCGPGQDTVRADAADVVAPDCETVERGGGGAGGGAGTKGGIAVAGKLSVRALLGKGVTVTVSGRRAGALVKVVVRRGAAVVASGSGRADAAGRAKVRVKVTRAGRRALRRARSGKLTVVAGSARATVRLKR